MWLGRTHTGDTLVKAAPSMLSIIREVDWAMDALTWSSVLLTMSEDDFGQHCCCPPQ